MKQLLALWMKYKKLSNADEIFDETIIEWIKDNFEKVNTLKEARLKKKTLQQELKDKVYEFLDREGQIWSINYLNMA